MRRRIWFSLTVVLLTTPLSATAGAQHLPPQMKSYRMSDSLLPVLDDFGAVIPEQLIQRNVTSRMGARIGFGLLGAAAGYWLGKVLSVPSGDPDCSIYEPCSEREKYFMANLPVLGALVGFLLTAVAPDYETDRFDAIAKIRAGRRMRQGRVPQ